MKVIEHLSQATEPLISFEIVPPTRGGNLEKLLTVVEQLRRFSPPFIDVTSHAAEATYEETLQGVRRKISRKRPGTLGLCTIIQQKYKIDAVPHILCRGYTREETEDFLIDVHYSGIQNVLALRGDYCNYQKIIQDDRSVNTYARDLVQQVAALNKGRYLHELLDSLATNFCIGVAGYPEKHHEAPSPEADIQHLKEKVDAGAEYIVTQMFFDNAHYFRFVDPNAKEIGVEWTTQQVQELLNRNVSAIHFYVMQNAQPVLQVLQNIV